MIFPPYPWQISQWQQLIAYVKQQKIPHALLFCGAKGLGKFEIAQAWIQYVLCEDNLKDTQPCQKCRNCHLFIKGRYVDIRLITPEASEKVIKIDQIRELIAFLNQTAQLGSYKIIVITPAETMNIAAQNALLKTLEEPPSPKTIILLMSAQSFLLPATIRSRCIRVNFIQSHEKVLRDYLVQQNIQNFNFSQEKFDLAILLAQGSPLIALHELQASKKNDLAIDILQSLKAIMQSEKSPLTVAEKWQKNDFETIVNCLSLWVMQLIKQYFIANKRIGLSFNKLEERGYMLKDNSVERTSNQVDEIFQQLSEQIDIQKLYIYLDELYEIKNFIQRQYNLNTQLLLESLLVKWSDMKLYTLR